MLKIYESLKAVFLIAFGTFTFVCYTFFMLALSSSQANLGPTSKLLHLTLFYAFLQGVCTLIHKLNAPSAVRRTVHFVLSLASFLLVFVAFGNYTSGAPKVLAMSGAFIGVYVIIAVVINIIHAVINRYQNKTLEYNLFVKEDKED